ncbi:MAG: hypothetical protein ACR2ID_07560 [Chthoniobacterales bacterium]
MVNYWSEHVPRQSILLAYGGERKAFDAITHSQKFFVEDPRLRTRDHQREYQSYSGLLRGAADALRAADSCFEFLHFAEYDHLPLSRDVNAKQIERLNAEGADLLGFHVRRVDETNYPHYLYHISNPDFPSFWGAISRREEPEVVLSMFGSGSFWRREAFLAVADATEPFPIYLEIYLPTLAHHLGFRVRDFGEQNRFVRALGDRTRSVGRERQAGGWTLHPVKRLWK